MQKLYCYVDESGQDTQGTFFVVAVVFALTTTQRDDLEQGLLALETRLRKGLDWRHTRVATKHAYVAGVIELLASFQSSMCYRVYRGVQSPDYDAFTVQAIIQAIAAHGRQHNARDVRVSLSIEGDVGSTRQKRFAKALKDAGVRYQRIRGLRFKSSALIRLADALAGVISDRERGKAYVAQSFKALTQTGLLRSV